MWRAVDQTLERPVSVRIVHADHPYAADILDAARRAALVDDSRLTRVLDVGAVDGFTYIVSEHVQGRVLADLLVRGPLPAETVRRVVGEAAQALDRAGARGLHHLRLSPSVVVIVPDGSVKLIGTAIDAAASGDETDDASAASRTDAVGLVSVLYAGLTGRWPGLSDGPLGPAPRVNGLAVPPGELVAGIPNDLDTLCSVTLGPHDDGPRTPGELAEQLSPWAHVAPLTDPHGLTLPPGRPTSVVDTPESTDLTAYQDDEDDEDEGDEDEGLDRSEAITLDATALRALRTARSDDHEPLPWQLIDLSGERTRPAPAPAPAPAKAAPVAPAPAAGTRSARSPRSAARTGVVTPPSTSVEPERRASTPRAGVDGTLADELLGGGRGLFEPRVPPSPPYGQGSSWDASWDPGKGSGGYPGGDAEPPGPLLPATPMARPPQRQTQLVILVLALLVVVGLILAVVSFWSFFGGGGDTTQTKVTSSVGAGAGKSSGASAGSNSGAASSGVSGPATPPPNNPPIKIVAVQALDPMGDGTENSKAAGKAADGNSGTAWTSEGYQSPTFEGAVKGGVKKTGVGLLLDLGTASAVHGVTLDLKGSGGVVEIRAMSDAGGSVTAAPVVGSSAVDGGRVQITLAAPVTTRYLVVWFTKLPKQSGSEYRAVVTEVAVT